VPCQSSQILLETTTDNFTAPSKQSVLEPMSIYDTVIRTVKDRTIVYAVSWLFSMLEIEYNTLFRSVLFKKETNNFVVHVKYDRQEVWSYVNRRMLAVG
jgi:hypothetical protein